MVNAPDEESREPTPPEHVILLATMRHVAQAYSSAAEHAYRVAETLREDARFQAGAHRAEIACLASTHREEIKHLTSTHREEIERLTREHRMALEVLRAEHQVALEREAGGFGPALTSALQDLVSCVEKERKKPT